MKQLNTQGLKESKTQGVKGGKGAFSPPPSIPRILDSLSPRTPFLLQLVSLIVAEAVLCSAVLPAWASPVDFLRPEVAADGRFRTLSHELRGANDSRARDGGLDQRLEEAVQRLPWLQAYQIDFKDPETYFGVHLGAHVQGSSSPPTMTYLFNRLGPVANRLHGAKIRLFSIPIDVPADPPTRLQELLEAIYHHPKILLVTSTEPHKNAVARWVGEVGEVDEEVYPIPSTNYVVIKRKKGEIVRMIGTNSDGPNWIEQYKEEWGRRGDQKGTLTGKTIVILGGWGGLGQALTFSILKERPRELVISELPARVQQARRELPELLGKLRERKPDWTTPEVTVVPAFDPKIPEKDSHDLLSFMDQADIIINATGIGMDEESSPLRNPAVFRPGQEVFDAIYRTKEGKPIGLTPFLRQAQGQGAKVFNGTGLFVRDLAGEARWLIKQLTGEEMGSAEVEEIYHAAYAYAKDERGVLEASDAEGGRAGDGGEGVFSVQGSQRDRLPLRPSPVWGSP